MCFRSGLISLDQFVAQVEHQKSGLKYAVLDDVVHDLHPLCRGNPHPAVKRAYYERENEKKALKNAAVRGVDPAILEKIARNLPTDERCMKALFFEPAKKKSGKKIAKINAARERQAAR